MTVIWSGSGMWIENLFFGGIGRSNDRIRVVVIVNRVNIRLNVRRPSRAMDHEPITFLRCHLSLDHGDELSCAECRDDSP